MAVVTGRLAPYRSHSNPKLPTFFKFLQEFFRGVPFQKLSLLNTRHTIRTGRYGPRTAAHRLESLQPIADFHRQRPTAQWSIRHLHRPLRTLVPAPEILPKTTFAGLTEIPVKFLLGPSIDCPAFYFSGTTIGLPRQIRNPSRESEYD